MSNSPLNGTESAKTTIVDDLNITEQAVSLKIKNDGMCDLDSGLNDHMDNSTLSVN